MKKLIHVLSVVLLSLQLAVPVYSINVLPGNGKVSQPVTVDSESTGRQLVNGTNTTVDTSTPGQIKVNAPSGGGGSSPFAPAGFAAVSTFNGWQELAIAPAGDYVYVAGKLASNSHGAIAKVKIADGTVSATIDLGGVNVQPQQLAISPDGASIYALDNAAGTTWWKVATSSMTLTHTSTLAVAALSGQSFDLSPDGSTYAYINQDGDAKLYMINTSTYAVTNATMSHTAGNLTAVCFYNGSNTVVKVAHAGSGDVDEYQTNGTYNSTVSTGAGGTPNFTAMRSGINNSFCIVDSGNANVIVVNSGTPNIIANRSISAIAANNLSPTAMSDGIDIYYGTGGGGFYFQFPGNAQITPLSMPSSVVENGGSGIALLPGSSENIFTLSGVSYPEVWSFAPSSVVGFSNASAAGNVLTTRGNGLTGLIAPYSTSGWTGTGTLSSGTATITCAPCTTTSKIMVTDTGTSLTNVGALQIRTKNNGSFVVDSTNTGDASTFDWVLVAP